MDDALLVILACTKCKGPMKKIDDDIHIYCEKCQLMYAINDGIPDMSLENAKQKSTTQQSLEEN